MPTFMFGPGVTWSLNDSGIFFVRFHIHCKKKKGRNVSTVNQLPSRDPDANIDKGILFVPGENEDIYGLATTHSGYFPPSNIFF